VSTGTQSILTTVKRTLGLEEDYTVFDQEVILHINSVFGTLHQLGVGPVNGFEIEDADAIWSDFLNDDLTLSPVKSYMYLRVRMLFDPPTLGYIITAMQEQIQELEWRINVVREDVMNLEAEDGEYILDGGSP